MSRHWKRNCPTYLKEVKAKGTLLVIEACFVADSTSSWIVDSGATNHVCCSLQGFRENKRLSKESSTSAGGMEHQYQHYLLEVLN